MSLIGDVERSGFVRHPPSPHRHTHLDAAILHLAGAVAEAKVLRQPVSTIVLDVAREDLLAAAKALMAAPPPRKTLAEALDLTRDLIDQRWPQIQAVAQALLDAPRGRLEVGEVIEVLRALEEKWTWRSLRWDDEVAPAAAPS
jgi:hypothetical protein